MRSKTDPVDDPGLVARRVLASIVADLAGDLVEGRFLEALAQERRDGHRLRGIVGDCLPLSEWLAGVNELEAIATAGSRLLLFLQGLLGKHAALLFLLAPLFDSIQCRPSFMCFFRWIGTFSSRLKIIKCGFRYI